MLNQKLPLSVRERYGHLPLSDSEFDVPDPVDMLIGGDLYPFMLQSRSDIIRSLDLPSALHTQFGWIIVRALKGLNTASTASSLTVCTTSEDHTLGELMHQFWAFEEPNIPHSPVTEDENCERHFQKTVSRDSNGRFYIALPFKSAILTYMDGMNKQEKRYDARSLGLGASRSLALNRLYNLERR